MRRSLVGLGSLKSCPVSSVKRKRQYESLSATSCFQLRKKKSTFESSSSLSSPLVATPYREKDNNSNESAQVGSKSPGNINNTNNIKNVDEARAELLKVLSKGVSLAQNTAETNSTNKDTHDLTSLSISQERNTLKDFLERNRKINELTSVTLKEGIENKDLKAINLAEKLENSLKWTELHRLQLKLEADRRLEAARTLRDEMGASIEAFNLGADEETLISKKLPNVKRIHRKDVRIESNLKKEIVQVGVNIEGQKYPAAPIAVQYTSWFANLVKTIEQLHDELQYGKAKAGTQKDVRINSILRTIPPDILSSTTLQQILNLVYQNSTGVPYTHAAVNVGRAVYEEWLAIQEKLGEDSFQSARAKVALNSQQKMSSIDRLTLERNEDANWSLATFAKVGGKLVELMCKSCFVEIDRQVLRDTKAAGLKLPEPEPAFFHSNAVLHKQLLGLLIIHPSIVEQYMVSRSCRQLLEQSTPNHRPMVFPPVPWTGPLEGGYLSTESSVLRTGKNTKHIRMLFNKDLDLSRVYDALNALGRVAWTLNQDVYPIAKEIQERDLGVTGLPLVHGEEMDELDEILHSPKPERPKATDRETQRLFRNAISEHAARKERARRTKQEYFSKHLDYTAKIDLAEFVKEHKRFWFPHSLDFRGRAYPIPPVSHMGDDLARAMLKFDQGKRLGERGLYWLKVHLANQMGYDKASFDDRVNWTEERLDKVFDSAKEPIDPNNPREQKWWATADNPFQCLATCIELYNALHSPSPEDFISHLTVHQDGSCNGLQHYAALGRDLEGGRKVNLVRGEKPGDVYSAVADVVRELITEEAANYDGQVPGDSLAMDFGTKSMTRDKQIYLAHKMKDQITRKLVKQTVMTSVYGVTFIGAREQIENRITDMNTQNRFLAARGEPHLPIIEHDELFQASAYIAKLTLASIGTTFKSAKACQHWLAGLSTFASACEQEVGWITPLGLPVLQPYHKASKREVRTSLQRMIISEVSSDSSVDKIKQRNAFPPNFVHSIDSTHMLMTARECEKAGLCFSAVHDSYWTHAGDTDEMAEVLREQFVLLHERELMKDLLNQFRLRFPQHAAKMQEPPMINTLDIYDVLDSPYFFS